MSSAFVQNTSLWLQFTDCVCFDFYFFKSLLSSYLTEIVSSVTANVSSSYAKPSGHMLLAVFLTPSGVSAPSATHCFIRAWGRKEKLINTNCLLQMYRIVLGDLHFTGCTSHLRLVWSSCTHSLSVLCSFVLFMLLSPHRPNYKLLDELVKLL